MSRIANVAGFLSGVACLSLAGCGTAEPSERQLQPPESLPAPAAVVAPRPSGPIDGQLADRGEQLYQTKGCGGCHSIGGGRLTGPDLAGVTGRREYEWFLAMVQDPDSMLREDPVARRLFAEYMTPMLPVDISRDDARAIYEFFRRHDR